MEGEGSGSQASASRPNSLFQTLGVYMEELQSNNVKHIQTAAERRRGRKKTGIKKLTARSFYQKVQRA